MFAGFCQWLNKQPPKRQFAVTCYYCPIACYLRETAGHKLVMVSPQYYFLAEDGQGVELPVEVSRFISAYDQTCEQRGHGLTAKECCRLAAMV